MTFITTMKEIKHRKWYIKNKSLGFLFVKTDPQSYQMFKSNRKLPCLQYAPSPKCCITLFMANFITFFSYLRMYYSTWDHYPISFSIFTKFLCFFVFLGSFCPSEDMWDMFQAFPVLYPFVSVSYTFVPALRFWVLHVHIQSDGVLFGAYRLPVVRVDH